MQVEEKRHGLSLVPYTEECLDKSWLWLNDPEIRQLTMTPVFTREEQRAFFKSLDVRSGYNIWGVSLQEFGLIGAAGLKNQRGSVAEYWGYIGERTLWGKGLGRALVSAVEKEARILGFHQLDLKVSVQNVRAIALYVKVGFFVDPDKSDELVLHMTKAH